MLDLIDRELKLEKFNIFKSPVFLILLPVGSLLLDKIFDKLELYWLLWIFFILTLILIVSNVIIKALRTEESKMNDLKFFIYWYETIYPNIEKFKHLNK